MKEFANVGSAPTMEIMYGIFAQIIASLYFMLVFVRANVPVFVCQFLDIQCRAFSLQLVDPCTKGSTSEEKQSPSGSDVCLVAEEQCEKPQHLLAEAPDLANSQCDIVPASPCKQPVRVTDLSLVESVKGLQGLKLALASKFMSAPSTLPDSFRQGYIVDLNQHWISVHAIFEKTQSRSSLSLIVFDTLEVNYQRYHEVGLLRSSSVEATATNPSGEDASIDVVSLCKMQGIQYDISFLAPICDMRRLTWEEEEQIRTDKKGPSSKSFTIYYDQHGNPFRKVIVQPILQAEQDGTCKSRALAVLGWLLKLDDKALAWYVASNRELFQVEIKASRGGVGGTFNQIAEPLDANVDEDGALFGSLMATGKRDKFGRDLHMKVCHVDTLQYNQNVEEIRPASAQHGLCFADASSQAVLLPGDSEELLLRQRREEELNRIREVLLRKGEGPVLDDILSRPSNVECKNAIAAHGLKQWRTIEDHEARWHFLEETCFFGHNLGFKKIRKKYPKDQVLEKEVPSAGALDASEDKSQGFGDTKFIRKYMVGPDNYITHEADPMFHKPIENFFGFLCGKEEEEQTLAVPFYVLPFPDSFTGLCLDNHVNGTNLILDLEGDFDEYSRQRVSDYSLPSGNSFLNDPISYNKAIANVSLPVKLSV